MTPPRPPSAPQAPPWRRSRPGSAREEPSPEDRLALITEGAIATTAEESPDPAAAAIWGLARSAQSEHPGSFVLLDSDGSDASEAAIEGASAQEEEPQLALREGAALAPRAVPLAGEGSPHASARPLAPDRRASGALEGLALLPDPAGGRPLGPTEVRVEMRAAGLNFRDVLIALGHYPGEATHRQRRGGDRHRGGRGGRRSGARRTGDGDALPGSFAATLVAERAQLLADPRGLVLRAGRARCRSSFAPRFTRSRDLAELKAGERVLIHAGAGGVGMAAIGIARRLGAEVFATASPAKWDALKGLGLREDHIASSRDPSFLERFSEQTGGEGVDVVLNALTGELLDASLELLPRGGRFLEMGKTDVRDPERIAAEHPGVAYMPFDLAEVGPSRTVELLAEVAAAIESGELSHSPVRTWDIRRAPEAFRHLREGRNVGKVVLIPAGARSREDRADHRRHRRPGSAHRPPPGQRARRPPPAAGEPQRQQGRGRQGAGRRARRSWAPRPSSSPVTPPIESSSPSCSPSCPSRVPWAPSSTSPAPSMTPRWRTSAGAHRRGLCPQGAGAWALHRLTEEAELTHFVCLLLRRGDPGRPRPGQLRRRQRLPRRPGSGQEAPRACPRPRSPGGFGGEGMGGALAEADIERMRGWASAPSMRSRASPCSTRRSPPPAPTPWRSPPMPRALRAMGALGVLPPILSGLVRVPKRRSQLGGALARQLAQMPEAQRAEAVLALVRSQVADVLGTRGRGDRPRARLRRVGLRFPRGARTEKPPRPRHRGAPRDHGRLRLPLQQVLGGPPARAGERLGRRPRSPSALPKPARSRSRSSACPVATPAGSPPPSSSGGCSPRAARGSPSSPPTAAGT